MINTEVFRPDQVPGQYNITNEQYHASEGISSSGLKLFARSPAHYYAAYLDPNRQPRKETPAFELGSLIHSAVLEPEKYFAQFYPLPRKLDRRLKDDKLEAEFHEGKAAEMGMKVITAEQHQTCERIVEAVHNSPAGSFLFGQAGLVEQSFYWQDWQHGVLCKARPDKLLPQYATILDLKSTTSAAKSDFARHAYNFEYHISAAFYMRGVEAVTGEAVKSFVFFPFEKEPPYACAFYEPDAQMLQAANNRIDTILANYAECLRTGEWPGYPQEIEPISLPAWAV